MPASKPRSDPGGRVQCLTCSEFNADDAVFCGSCGAAVRAPEDAGRSARHPFDGASGNHASASDATRYLCAAVQLDSMLAERVIREIVDEEFKAPPSSPEVDLIKVLQHALAARGRQLVRDVILTLLLFVLIVLLATGVSVILTVIIGLLLAWLVVSVEQVVTTYGVVARELRPGAVGAAPAPPPGSWAAHRLDQLARRSGGNVTVAGDYNPFVGSGGSLDDAWSFTLDIGRAAEGQIAQPFSVHEIHDHVFDRLTRVGLPGVSLDEQVFVDGRDLRGDRRFLPDELAPPVPHVDDTLVRALIAAPEDHARTYIRLRVTGWRGQLVLSTFLRFVVTGQNLFIELSHSLLTPVLERYQEVDNLLPQPSFRQLLRIARRSFTPALVGLFLAPFAVTRAIFAPLRRHRHRARQRREITTALRFNYGPIAAPREVVSDSRYQRYFQQLDRSLYSKVVEKRLLEAIVSFLDDKGIDTHELIERQTTILNNGVYITGQSTVNAQSIAGGLGARAKTRLTRTGGATKGG
jgi:hypothetical protein